MPRAHSQSVAILRGEISKIQDGFVCIEGKVVCELPLDYFVFFILLICNIRMAAPIFFLFLEYLFLGVTPPKRSKLQNFITSITNT